MKGSQTRAGLVVIKRIEPDFKANSYPYYSLAIRWDELTRVSLIYKP